MRHRNASLEVYTRKHKQKSLFWFCVCATWCLWCAPRENKKVTRCTSHRGERDKLRRGVHAYTPYMHDFHDVHEGGSLSHIYINILCGRGWTSEENRTGIHWPKITTCVSAHITSDSRDERAALGTPRSVREKNKMHQIIWKSFYLSHVVTLFIFHATFRPIAHQMRQLNENM